MSPTSPQYPLSSMDFNFSMYSCNDCADDIDANSNDDDDDNDDDNDDNDNDDDDDEDDDYDNNGDDFGGDDDLWQPVLFCPPDNGIKMIKYQIKLKYNS